MDTIFITGAGKGLGLSLARRFLRAGFHVFAGIHSPDRDTGTLFASTEAVTPVPLDVTDMESVREAARRVAAHTPALDILINNAAVYLETRAALEALDLTGEYLARTLDVNTFGPLRVTQQFLPLLERGRRKLIVNISSEAGSIADCTRRSEFAYCMSKAALNMQTKILHNALKPRGFRVLAVHPGWMRTDMGGPDADIHPDEAAEGIFRLAESDWDPDEGIYRDYRGNAMRW